jgi:hypothetical protein
MSQDSRIGRLRRSVAWEGSLSSNRNRPEKPRIPDDAGVPCGAVQALATDANHSSGPWQPDARFTMDQRERGGAPAGVCVSVRAVGRTAALAPERTSWPVCRRHCSYPRISAAAGAAPIRPGRTISRTRPAPHRGEQTALRGRWLSAGRVPRGYLRFKTRRCREVQERGAAPISGQA